MCSKRRCFFFATALSKIIGCFLPWLWLKKGGSVLLLIPASVALIALCGMLIIVAGWGLA
ncbi:hypothetical protein INS04_11355 [Enterobacter asburiae]|nr:hypothetical protein INS04_11355 [Enterobacter asburiae]